MTTTQKMNDWLREYLGQLLGIAPAAIVLERSLNDYGLDSVDAVLMAGEMEVAFAIEIDPASMLQHPTFAAMITAVAPAVES